MMKLNWIKFKNLDTGLTINKTEFNSLITLLVGKSGAGKTQILNSVKVLCGAATGCVDIFSNCFSASLCFTINEDEYIWKIETRRTIDKDALDLIKQPFYITDELPSFFRFFTDKKDTIIVKSESLTCNGNFIFRRRNGKIDELGQYNGLPTPRNDTSLISQYKDDKILKNVYNHLRMFYQIPNSSMEEMTVTTVKQLNESIKSLQNNNLDEYRKSFPSNSPLICKLYLLKKSNPFLFGTFLTNFTEVFSDVDDVDIKEKEGYYNIYIRTNGVDIDYNSVSSGMRKTMRFLCDMLTLSNDNVVLVDEYENSLGVNCLDEVLKYLYLLRDDLQFIITSHHPYIINNLDWRCCKIVQRTENIINTQKADKIFKFANQHDYFIELINLLKNGDK